MRKFIKLIAASLVCTLTISSAVYAGENVKGENAGNTKEIRLQDSCAEAGIDGDVTFSDINGYNKIVKYKNDDLEVDYHYDEIGRRICKNVNGVVFDYEYNGERLVKEIYDGNEIEYIYGDDDLGIPKGFVYDNSLYIYKKDNTGNIVGITTEDHSASAEYVFNNDWILQEVVTDNESGTHDIYNAALKNHFMGIGYYYDSELEVYYNGRYYSTITDSFLGSLYSTENISERVIMARGSVDYDMEADKWAQELLNSSSYGKAMGDYSENWYSELSTVEILARLIYGENNGLDKTTEREAIAWLLIYRLGNPNEFGTGLRGVATKYEHFSTIYPSNDISQDERNTNTKNSMNPFGDMAWRSATYLACLISLTQNTDNIYQAIGKPSYYSDQVFFYSYKSVHNNTRLSGSGDSMKMKGWNDTILAVKDVVIVAVGKYTNSDDIYTDDVYKKSYEKRNVFYNLK